MKFLILYSSGHKAIISMKTDGRRSIQSIGIMLALLLMAIGTLSANVFGQITLYMPTGVRSGAMGGCGYALSDDETALFYNPAGLGLRNERWNGGALYYSSSNYDFGFTNDYYGVAYQNEKLPKLGFSGYLNRMDYGAITQTWFDSSGNIVSGGKLDDLEFTAAIGGGYNLFENEFAANAVGLAIKYYRHQAFGENFTGPIVFDAGYVVQMMGRIRLGIVLKNIGPDITGTINDSTKETEKLPFTFGTGFGYKDAFNIENLRVLDLSSEFSYSSVRRGFSSRLDNSIQTGIDLQFFRIFSAQLGYSLDLTYNYYNLSWGTGFSLFNHFEFNFFWEQYHSSYGYDNYVKTGVSTSFKRVLNWSRKDRRWWLD
jgi:hypothetical protein